VRAGLLLHVGGALAHRRRATHHRWSVSGQYHYATPSSLAVHSCIALVWLCVCLVWLCLPSHSCRLQQGGYCPTGSSQALSCPAGTYGNATGLYQPSQCAACLPGQYCAGSALAYPTGPCLAGYYCTGGAAAPTQQITPAGSYSLSGASQPAPCAPGSYNPNSGQSACTTCPAGFMCPNFTLTAVQDCPPGSYCPAGTSAPAPPCPLGTYSTAPNLRNSSECVSCPAGSYCPTLGAALPAGLCAAGYYCSKGSSSATQQVCPAGSYCTNGTVTPAPCPAGTYNPATASTSLAACLSCTPGSYCASAGLSAPTALCAAGYYCTGSARSAQPLGDGTGDVCPAGRYCPAGASSPLVCAPGTYMDQTGYSSCFVCPVRAALGCCVALRCVVKL
jgi:hypothetical protein